MRNQDIQVHIHTIPLHKQVENKINKKFYPNITITILQIQQIYYTFVNKTITKLQFKFLSINKHHFLSQIILLYHNIPETNIITIIINFYNDTKQNQQRIFNQNDRN